MISPRLLVASLSLRVSNMFFHAHKCTCGMDEKGLGRDKCSLVSTTPIMSWPSPSSLTCFTSLSLPDLRRKSDCLIQSMLDNSGKSAQYLINIGENKWWIQDFAKWQEYIKYFFCEPETLCFSVTCEPKEQKHDVFTISFTPVRTDRKPLGSRYRLS